MGGKDPGRLPVFDKIAAADNPYSQTRKRFRRLCEEAGLYARTSWTETRTSPVPVTPLPPRRPKTPRIVSGGDVLCSAAGVRVSPPVLARRNNLQASRKVSGRILYRGDGRYEACNEGHRKHRILQAPNGRVQQEER